MLPKKYFPKAPIPSLRLTQPLSSSTQARRAAISALAPILMVLLMGASLAAQSLTINGRGGVVSVPLESFAQIDLVGPPGQVHYWGFDTDAGPTAAGALSIPLGFSANFIDLGMGMPMPLSGHRNLTFAVAGAGLLGLEVHSVAAFVDGLGAVTLTNGVTLRITPKGAHAGPDGAALVGQSVAVDGSRMLDAAGLPLPGVLPIWSIEDAPLGASASFNASNVAVPTFTTDTPGRYTLVVETPTLMGMSRDECLLDVYEIAFSSPIDGQFLTGNVNVQGTVDGPGGVQQFALNGSPIALAGNAFAVANVALAGSMHSFTGSLTLQSGQVLEQTICVVNNAGIPVGESADVGTATRLQNVDLEFIEAPIELLLGAIPLNTIIIAIPTLPIINSPPFLTANFTFTGATYDPAVDLDIFPTTGGGIGVGITFTNLVINADVTGAIFGLPYNETATISAVSATTTTSILIGSDAQGVTTVSTQGTNTTFNNFQFVVTGVLGGLTQLGAIQTAAQGAIVLALNGLAELIPTALNPLLSSFALNVDLSATGIPVVVGLPVAGVNYDVNGLTIGNRVGVTPLVQGAESPVLTRIYTTASTLPAFGATTPVAGATFTFGQTINDDLLNQFLAGLTTTGAFDINWTDLLGTSLDAALAASILPGAGFEALAATTPVRAEVRHTTAPVFTFDGISPVGTLRLCNLRLTFKAEIAPGVWSDIARYGASSEASVTIGIDPGTGALTTSVGTPTIAVTLAGFLPGYDGAAGVAGVVSIVQAVIPLITAPFSSIPLPGAGLGGGLLREISMSPGTSDNLTIYFGL